MAQVYMPNVNRVQAFTLVSRWSLEKSPEKNPFVLDGKILTGDACNKHNFHWLGLFFQYFHWGCQLEFTGVKSAWALGGDVCTAKN